MTVEPTHAEVARFFRHLAKEDIKKAHHHRKEAEKWLTRAQEVDRLKESKEGPGSEPEA